MALNSTDVIYLTLAGYPKPEVSAGHKPVYTQHFSDFDLLCHFLQLEAFSDSSMLLKSQ